MGNQRSKSSGSSKLGKAARPRSQSKTLGKVKIKGIGAITVPQTQGLLQTS